MIDPASDSSDGWPQPAGGAPPGVVYHFASEGRAAAPAPSMWSLVTTHRNVELLRRAVGRVLGGDMNLAGMEQEVVEAVDDAIVRYFERQPRSIATRAPLRVSPEQVADANEAIVLEGASALRRLDVARSAALRAEHYTSGPLEISSRRTEIVMPEPRLRPEDVTRDADSPTHAPLTARMAFEATML